MVNNQRIVRFADCVEEIEMDNNRSFIETATDRYSDDGSNNASSNTSLNKPAASSSGRSAWNPDEASLCFQHQSSPQTSLDLTPRQPLRSLDSILTDALKTCEHFSIPLGSEDLDTASSTLQQDEGNRLTIGLPSSFFSLTNNDDDAASVHLPPLPTLYRRRVIPLRSSCLFSQAM